MTQSPKKSSLALTLGGIALMFAGAVAGWQFERMRGAGGDIGPKVREYLLENPEVLPEAMERLRQKETGKQLAAAGDKLFAEFPGAVLGNPQGKVTLVEFTDFACTFCRASVGEVEALIRDNPDLKVVVRELPILSPKSADAARWALAAAEQGKYPAFHKAMFAAGKPDDATIEAAARVAGLDLDRARRFIANPRVDGELRANIGLAQQLGFDGTPAWVVGDQALSGAVGREALAKAIAKARES